MAVRKHLLHLKSNALNTNNDGPKLPTAQDLEYGEIAINYRDGHERLSIKNSNNEIVSFVSSEVIEENEQVTAAALAQLNSDINTINSDIEEVNQTIEDNELAVAAALSDLDERATTATSAITALTTRVAVTELNDNLEEITYSNLVTKRTNSQLVPGKYYRITDYVTTTVQDDTQSAGHQFDVVVLALDESTLSENAHAMLHDGDTYFSTNGADLSSWEIKYCLDNDTTRFAWADSTNGKGVIYYMKDEWNNECPYDFKNIQFKRWAVTGVQNSKLNQTALDNLKSTFIYDDSGENFSTRYAFQSSNITNGDTSFTVDSTDYAWYYTFSTIKYENESYAVDDIEDASIKGNNFYNDEGGGGCFGNTIKPFYDNMASENDGIDGSQYLNNNVFNGYYGYYETAENGYAYHAFTNLIGYNSRNNTFGNDCWYNTFGNYFRYNTFGNNAYGNTFGNYCYYNTFGNGCGSNTFGNNCGSNTFGNECYNNSFGNNCNRNLFGNECSNNSFGNYFRYNTFGNDCGGNSFGNYFQYNTFGNSCFSNTFGNDVKYFNSQNTDWIRWIIVENGNSYITLVASPSTTQNSYLQNIKIAQGTNNATAESGRKTITHTTTNDGFRTVYQNSNSTVQSV